MRKYLIIAFILLTGCAGQKGAYYSDESIPRLWVYPIVQKVSQCLDHPVQIKVLRFKTPNAFADGEGNIIFTESALRTWDRNTLAFVAAHEIAHEKLGHVTRKRSISYAITGAMMVVNAFVPGAGYLNHAINPAVVKAYSREQELDADKMASDACTQCLGIPIAQQVAIMNELRKISDSGGGFWSTHPSWDDRIKNISAPMPQP